MVANRVEAGKEGADKAAAPAAAAAPTASGGGGAKAWMPLIISLVAMPVVAYAVTSFVLLPKLQKGLGITAEAHGGGEAKASSGGHGAKAGEKGGKDSMDSKRQNATMGKLLVNVSGTSGSRYLMTTLTLVGSAADFKTRLEHFDPQLRDMAGSILSAKTIPDLEKAGARNLIRTELITGFNSILGPNMVEEIFITEFAIQ